jgi:hypothetical protein
MTMVMKMMKKEREEDEFMGFVLLLKFFFFIEKRFLTIKSKVEIKKNMKKNQQIQFIMSNQHILHTHILLIVPHH